jgi:hypothetical protein
MVKTIDIAPYFSAPIDLIKMDIEGAEYDVIPHLGDRLGSARNMVIECLLDNKRIERFAHLLSTLRSTEFRVSVNSYGAWRDLAHQPAKLPNEFDQYVLVVAWRDNGG